MIKEVIEEVPDRFTVLINGKLVMNGKEIAHFKVDPGNSFKLVCDGIETTVEIKKTYRMVPSDDPDEGMFDRLYPEEKDEDE